MSFDLLEFLKSFNMMAPSVVSFTGGIDLDAPILVLLESHKPFVVFNDALKYGLRRVMM